MSAHNIQLPLIPEAAPLVVAAQPFVVFELAIEPRGWERPGAMIRKGRDGTYIHWYVRAEEATYREAIQWAAKAEMRGRELTCEPVALLVHAFIAIPASWHWKKKQAARSGAILPTGKPDFDNIGKVVADALKTIVWIDDATVVDGRVIKRYADEPGLRVEVREMLTPNAA